MIQQNEECDGKCIYKAFVWVYFTLAFIASLAAFVYNVIIVAKNDFSINNDSIKLYKMLITLCILWLFRPFTIILVLMFRKCKKEKLDKVIIIAVSSTLASLFVVICISTAIVQLDFNNQLITNQKDFNDFQKIVKESKKIGAIQTVVSIVNVITVLLILTTFCKFEDLFPQ